MIFHYMQRIKPFLIRFEQHPFNLGLLRGNLDPQIFHRFLEQDPLYLLAVSQSTQRLAEHANNEIDQRAFLQLAHHELKAVEKLQHKYQLKTTPHIFFKPTTIQPIPILKQQIFFLNEISQSHSTTAMITSILPCFLLYMKLGQKFQTHGYHTNNPYQLWMKSYQSDWFISSTQWLIQYLNKSPISAEQAELLIKILDKSAQFEFDFIDQIYYNRHQPMPLNPTLHPTLHPINWG